MFTKNENSLIKTLSSKPNKSPMENKKLFTINNPLRCLSEFSLQLLSYWQQAARTKQKLSSLRFVPLLTRITQGVYLRPLLHLFQSKRHLLGVVLLGAGVIGFFSGSFFNPMNYDHAPCRVFGLADQCYNFSTQQGWCFMNWFYYLDTITWAIGLLFWSVAVVLFIPSNYGLAIIPASLLHALAWVKILHVTFFARSYESYHAFPEWQIIAAALGLGFGIVMSADFLLYWENHKKRGNWQKWPAIFRSPLSQEEKNRLYAMADKEYDQVNRMI